jgi:hypothetical protein
VRMGRIALIMIVGCAPAVGAASRGEDGTPARMEAPVEAVLLDPAVPLAELIDQTADGAQLIGLYRTARTIQDVEAANESAKAQVIKAQSVASNVARLHAASIKSCEDTEASQVEAIGTKVRAFSATLAQVDGELVRSLAAMRQKVESQRPPSIRAKEDVNRLVLATHEIGRLRVQAQEIAKSVEGLAASIRTAAAACTPTLIPPLFAERTPASEGAAPSARSPSLPAKRTNKRTNTSAPRLFW